MNGQNCLINAKGQNCIAIHFLIEKVFPAFESLAIAFMLESNL